MAVGTLNTAFGYGCFALLMWLGMHYTAALLLATVVGVLFNFKTLGKLVFGQQGAQRLWRFVATYAICYGFNLALVKLFLLLGIGAYVGGALALVPVALLSFYLNRIFVFRHA
ncbi:polysaccharide biosynthesis protein GtrA [Achromobacter xylosoxidans]|nr:polysaccharide biosynthesis protein GtrA [Achromobacter xylosoxidans]